MIQTVELPIEQLRESEYNPRTISKDQFEALKRSMREDPGFMEVRPLIVNSHAGRENVVIGGNMRLRAAKELMKEGNAQWAKVPCRVVSVPEAVEKRWALKDNNSFGRYEQDLLSKLVEEMDQLGEDITSIGFNEKDLDQILYQGRDVAGTLEEDEFRPEEALASTGGGRH